MDRVDFLKAVLPAGTRYALRVIQTKGDEKISRNLMFDSIEEAGDAIDTYNKKRWDVYYATAGFGAANHAQAPNAVSKRELYIDLDCGEKKPYPTKADGITALRTFVQSLGLPKPTLIDSGNGIHVHWYFNEPVPVHEWHGVAEALKEHCISKGLIVDHGCTADIVRVLRIPGTINRKNDSNVLLLTPVKYYEFDTLRSLIGEKTTSGGLFSKTKERKRNNGQSEVAKLLSSNISNKFETIWIKSTGGTGCAQIKHAIEESETLPEPVWRAVLSVAQFCEDRDWAIHEVSKNHPGYSAEETEQKAALTKGPYTCETFQGLDTAQLCAGCPHAGKITSPIQLGSEVKEAASEDNNVVVNDVTYTIPTYPFPFFRGKNGGIYVRDKTEDDEGGAEVAKVVYPYDLYAYKRMRDPEVGDIVMIRHHLPNDGVREFAISQRDLSALDRLRDKLSEQGVTIIVGKQIANLQFVLSKQTQDLQAQAKADKMHSKFGWTKDNTFIIGNREYTKDGVRIIPVARALEKYLPWFEPAGTLDAWKEVINVFNAPEFDYHAFGVLVGFGSVLMKLSPEKGGVVNYFSKKSGTGKTTILRLANSIYGDPSNLMKTAEDTALSKVHRMGVLNGIVTTLDEMTNTHPQEMSTLLYGCTQGRARDRMKSGENAERYNDTGWHGASLWSSNTAIEDRLSLIKNDPAGEMARVIEIYLSTSVPSDVLEAQKVFDKVNHNYGHAIDVFLRYLIPNLGDANLIWEQVRTKVYSLRSWSQVERFRLNLVICGIAAGVITNSLGLTSFNVARIMRRMADHVAAESANMAANAVTAIDSFTMFINSNVSNMLVIDDKTRSNSLQSSAYKEPKGRLVIRYEPDTDTLYIAVREFNKWCAESFVNAKEIPTMFKRETGTLLSQVKKRIGKGWDTDFGLVSAYEIKYTKQLLALDPSSLKENVRESEQDS